MNVVRRCCQIGKPGIVQRGRVLLLAESNLELCLYRSKWSLFLRGMVHHTYNFFVVKCGVS